MVNVTEAFDIEYRRLDRYVQTAFRASEAFKRRYQLYIVDEFLSRLAVDSEGRILQTLENEQVLAELEREFYINLDRAGMNDLMSGMMELAERRIATINYLTNKLGLDTAVLSRDDAFSMPSVVESLELLARSGMEAGYRYQPEIAQTVLEARVTLNSGGQKEYKKFLETYMSKVGTIPRYVGTVAGTMLARMDRLLRREQARRAGIEHGKYVGPVDPITRRYCRHTVGAVKTWEEWDKAQNEVGPQPVSEWGGGWNCRHAIIFYDKEWE